MNRAKFWPLLDVEFTHEGARLSGVVIEVRDGTLIVRVECTDPEGEPGHDLYEVAFDEAVPQ